MKWTESANRSNNLVRCIIESEASPSTLTAEGIKVISSIDNIKTVEIPLNELDNLENSVLIKKIYKDIPDIELMDSSRPYNYINGRYSGC